MTTRAILCIIYNVMLIQHKRNIIRRAEAFILPVGKEYVMTKMMKKMVALGLTLMMAVPAGAVYAGETEAAGDAELSLAYQYGLGYAAVTIAQQEGLIEKAYKEATGADLTITWNQMSSGADINTVIWMQASWVLLRQSAESPRNWAIRSLRISAARSME